MTNDRSPRGTFGRGVACDLRSAARLLVKDRGFTATTVLTLAVCLGAYAAVFTVVYSVLLRPLPVPHPERIVAMGDVYPTITPDDILSNTAPAYFDRLGALTTLATQAAFSRWSDTITIDGVSEEITGVRATPSLFRVMQVPPALGRGFSEAEGEIGADQEIILSDGLWQRLYGGDPAALGRELRLGWTGRSYTIVGVMPRGFSFFDPQIQFWIPLTFTPAQRSDNARTRYAYFHVGRMADGAGVAQVKAQVDALNAATFKRFPQLGLAELGMYTAVTPLQDALTRDVRGILYLLWGGAAFVLLIGAINITNLALARATVRARELATRVALGAGRLRLTRQLVIESACLASIGGIISLGVAASILAALSSRGLDLLPNAAYVELDRTVMATTVAISVLVGIVIGLVPAATIRGANVNQVLVEGSRTGTAGRGARLFRRGLVIAQVAFSIVLLAGATLLLTSFRNLLAVDYGFDAGRVVTGTIFPPPSRYPDQPAMVALSNRLLDAVRALPGVTGAGITSNVALSGRTSPATVAAADAVPAPNAPLILPSVVSVTPGYFETMGVALLRGRYFTDADGENALRAAIVDERLAARLWPNGDPIGKAVNRGTPERYTVVGVVRDVRFESAAASGDSIGTAYFPHTQLPAAGRLRWIAIKTTADAPGAVRQLRAALMAIDPDLPLSDVQTMTQRLSRSLMPQKLAMSLAGVFAVVALFLSMLGIYGVLSYVVAQRRRELGIRIALGSTAWGIFRLVLREGLVLVAGGLALGLTGALTIGRALQGHLFGVSSHDPLVLSAVLVATGIIGTVACVSPARRATRVDPRSVLSDQ